MITVSDGVVNLSTGTLRQGGVNVALGVNAGVTDNTLPRWSGTGGQILQGSGIAVDNSNNVSGLGTVAGGTYNKITSYGSSYRGNSYLSRWKQSYNGWSIRNHDHINKYYRSHASHVRHSLWYGFRVNHLGTIGNLSL